VAQPAKGPDIDHLMLLRYGVPRTREALYF
jgi:hypothetical protein